jgi:hypothetical protein
MSEKIRLKGTKRSEASRKTEIDRDLVYIQKLQSELAKKYRSYYENFIEERLQIFPHGLDRSSPTEDVLLHRAYTNTSEDYEAIALWLEHNSNQDCKQLTLHSFDLLVKYRNRKLEKK